jgi:hypothetical protein
MVEEMDIVQKEEGDIISSNNLMFGFQISKMAKNAFRAGVLYIYVHVYLFKSHNHVNTPPPLPFLFFSQQSPIQQLQCSIAFFSKCSIGGRLLQVQFAVLFFTTEKSICGQCGTVQLTPPPHPPPTKPKIWK